MWLATLNERGMLRASFIPPVEIRQLRDCTWRPTDILGVSGRAMMEALLAGERDPQALAALARGRMRVGRRSWRR